MNSRTPERESPAGRLLRQSACVPVGACPRAAALLLVCLYSAQSCAAEQGAGSPVSPTAQLGQVVMGLVVVVLLILALSFLLRRFKVLPGQGGGVIRVIGGLSLGARERLILVQVGEEQILLSAGGGGVRKVHVLDKAVLVEVPRPASENVRGGFAGVLETVTRGRRS